MPSRRLATIILKPVTKAEFMAPAKAEFLSIVVTPISSSPMLSYEIDPSQPHTQYVVSIFKTDDMVPHTAGKFVGSFVLPLQRPTVFHVYIRETEAPVDAEFSEVPSEATAAGDAQMPGLTSSGAAVVEA